MRPTALAILLTLFAAPAFHAGWRGTGRRGLCHDARSMGVESPSAVAQPRAAVPRRPALVPEVTSQPVLASGQFTQLLAELSNHDGAVRISAAAELRAIVVSDILTEAQRRWLATELIAIVAGGEVAAIEAPHLANPRSVAVSLLGRLGTHEAIVTLVDHIDEEFPTVFPSRHDLHRYRAATALVRIGEPAIGPILERVGRADETQWRAMWAALAGIDEQTPALRRKAVEMLERTDVREPGADDAASRERSTINRRLRQFLATPEPTREALAKAPSQL